MKQLLTIYESDIFPDRINHDSTNFNTRMAARAVVLDSDNRVALLHAETYAYHKLPGGGVEDGEDIHTALKRESLEEIGCDIQVISEVGEIDEYRDGEKLHQISYCYVAKQIGKQQPPEFTKGEIDDGFAIVWVDDINSAIKLLESDKPKNYNGRFIQRRDITLLKTAKELLSII